MNEHLIIMEAFKEIECRKQDSKIRKHGYDICDHTPDCRTSCYRDRECRSLSVIGYLWKDLVRRN